MTPFRTAALGGLRFLAFACVLLTSLAQAATARQDFEQALDLIHSSSGSREMRQRAFAIIDRLAKDHPRSGYAETLIAESASTWELDEDGLPAELRQRIIAVADAALTLDPRHAQAHVAKGRVYVRASLYPQAKSSIDAALALEPSHAGAIFLRADVFRRTGALDDAESWYLKFIEATPSPGRKANGYAWIGRMYADVARGDAQNRRLWVDKARRSYDAMLRAEPGGAWRNVNYAIFLNELSGDYQAAELYAQKALDIMEFPMARYHLAAARYQQVLSRSTMLSDTGMREAVKRVSDSTRVTLEQAIAFENFPEQVESRLRQLSRRVGTTVR